jgi:phosphohistidine phosphatase
MKTIYLIRHAESGSTKKTSDFDRVLTTQGVLDAELMSKQMNFATDVIISSPAKRTTETATIFANALNYMINKIDYEINIYEAPVQNLINKINQIDSKNDTAVLVGHNPGITLLANYLTAEQLNLVSPCSIIKIELEIDNWNEVIQGIGLIKFINQP